jgi:hypothetical protein
MLLHLCIKFHVNIHMNKEAVKSYNFEKIFFLRTVEFLSNLTGVWCAPRVQARAGRLAAASTTTKPLARSDKSIRNFSFFIIAKL